MFGHLKPGLRPSKGQVIRATFPCNLLRNIVALQVAKLCCPYYDPHKQLAVQQFQCCKLQQHVARSRTRFYFWQQMLMFDKLLAGVVIRATKLCNNVAPQVARKCCPYYLALKKMTNDRLPRKICTAQSIYSAHRNGESWIIASRRI